MKQAQLAEIKNTLDSIHDHTRWTGFNVFTPKQIEPLVLHIEECHKVLRELAGITDWQAPFRIPEVRGRAEVLLGKVS